LRRFRTPLPRDIRQQIFRMHSRSLPAPSNLSTKGGSPTHDEHAHLRNMRHHASGTPRLSRQILPCALLTVHSAMGRLRPERGLSPRRNAPCSPRAIHPHPLALTGKPRADSAHRRNDTVAAWRGYVGATQESFLDSCRMQRCGAGGFLDSG
jgi:hypothetical protein